MVMKARHLLENSAGESRFKPFYVRTKTQRKRFQFLPDVRTLLLGLTVEINSGGSTGGAWGHPSLILGKMRRNDKR